MISRAVVCPSPPLLAADLSGRGTAPPDLREACGGAVARLLADGSGALAQDRLAVVAAGPATRTWDPDSRLDRGAYGPGLPAGTAGLPLGLGLGAMLLDDAGYTGTRLLQAVAEDAPARECLDLGQALADGPGRTGLLVVGDGTARRTAKAPGRFDERAASFDTEAERALRDGDLASLADLDPRLARDLMATGRAAWQVLAGALEAPVAGEVLYSDAPFGVCYLVAVLSAL